MDTENFIPRNATSQDYEFLYNLHLATMKQYVERTWGCDEARAVNMFRERFNRGHHQIVVVDGKTGLFNQVYVTDCPGRPKLG